MSALIALSFVTSLSAGQIWVNDGKPAQVVELFTSEGCSSCPPADRFLSKLEQSPQLWQEIIPIAYHVDYWDYLGWQDKFARPEYSQLQRLYHAYDVVSSVYTPSFVVDNKEWRGFFNWVNRDLPNNAQKDAGRLTLVRSDNAFELSYQHSQPLEATIIFVANNRTTEIKAGENRGRRLEHDFIAVLRTQARSNNGKWKFTYEGDLTKVDAVAAWVSPIGSFERIQTVAGKIE